MRHQPAAPDASQRDYRTAFSDVKLVVFDEPTAYRAVVAIDLRPATERDCGSNGVSGLIACRMVGGRER